MSDKAVLNIIYTNIGRGHPFYLDGIVRRLEASYADRIEINIENVFGLSTGMARYAWKLIRYLYHAGSQGGAVGFVYDILRKKRSAGGDGIAVRILSRGIREFVNQNRYPTLVAHPLLVTMISDIVPVYFVHGEHAVPDEAAVKGAKQVFVPTENAAAAFINKGVGEDITHITGLCIEEELAAGAKLCFENRMERLSGEQPPIGGFFSSGAEPEAHVDKIIRMLISLKNADMKAVVLCKQGGRFEKALKKNLRINIIESKFPDGESSIRSIAAISYESRDELDELSARISPHFDYIVAPSHEKTNWALGLGLPIFILHPIIGTFSPLNRKILVDSKTAFDIDTFEKASGFSSILMRLKNDGILRKMATNGFGRNEIDGFLKIASFLVDELTVNQ